MPKFRRVTGLFRAAIPDGPDADYTPDLEALNGQIEFVPRYRGGVIAYPHLDPPEFVRPEPIQAVLQDGRVMTQVSAGEETTIQPVELMVSDDDEAAQSWQWEAVFRDIRVGRWGDEVSISPLRFTVPDEHGPLDLTEVVGEKSGGTVTVKGPRGEGITDLRAENGQLIVEWGAGKQLTIPVPEAVPGPKGDKGDKGDPGATGPPGTVDLIGGAATITVDTSVGTRVLVGGVMIYGDTGWRNISSLLTFRDDYINMSGSPTPILIVRRTLNEVEFRLEFRARSAPLPSTVPTIASGIPAGFRVQFMREILLDGSNFSGAVGMINGSGGSIVGRVITDGAGRLVWGSGRYPTSDAWPTALPGTAA